jgi:hypothetical protein
MSAVTLSPKADQTGSISPPGEKQRRPIHLTPEMFASTEPVKALKSVSKQITTGPVSPVSTEPESPVSEPAEKHYEAFSEADYTLKQLTKYKVNRSPDITIDIKDKSGKVIKQVTEPEAPSHRTSKSAEEFHKATCGKTVRVMAEDKLKKFDADGDLRKLKKFHGDGDLRKSKKIDGNGETRSRPTEYSSLAKKAMLQRMTKGL